MMKTKNILKLCHFIFFMNIAALFPFLNLYLSEIGLSGIQIGTIVAVGLFMTTIGQPIWGFISDFFGTRKRILQFNVAASFVLIIAASFSETFLILLVILAIFRFIRSPLMRIIDTITLSSPDPEVVYGKIRLWGSVGFTVAVVFIGELLELTSLKNSFYIFAFLAGVFLIISSFLPGHVEVKDEEEGTISGRHVFNLIKNNLFLLFLIFSFLVGLGFSMHLVFFSIYMSNLGAGEGLIGIAWALSALVEVPVFFYSDNLLEKSGSTNLLFFGALLFGVCWFLYALASSPLMVLVVQVLVGSCFALFYSSGVTFVSQTAPSGLQATGQGIFGAFFIFGLSGMVGSFLGGLIFDTMGFPMMYSLGGVVCVIAAFLFILASRKLETSASAESTYG